MMRRHILLTGPSGCGKSTLLMNVLETKLKTAGGFCTTRIFDSQGILLGFRHIPPYELISLTEILKEEKEGIFLSFSKEGLIQKEDVLLNYTLPLIKNGAKYPFIIMDEIGGYELLLPEFRKAINQLLEHEVPCIGVLKNEQNSRSLMEYRGISDRYRNLYAAFVNDISSNSKVSVIKCTGDTIDDAKESILAWKAVQGI